MPQQMYPTNGMPMNMYPGQTMMSTAAHSDNVMSRNMSPSHRTRDKSPTKDIVYNSPRRKNIQQNTQQAI